MQASPQEIIETAPPPQAVAYLLPKRPDTLSRPIPLMSGRITIGRSPKNTVTVEATTVSRHHAVIVSSDGRYYIKDLKSRNGTFVNNRRIDVNQVDHHDRITIGDQRFIFLVAADEEVAPKGDPLLDAGSSLALSREAMEPSGFLAGEAEQARLDLFPAQDRDLPPQPADSDARPLTLLQRLSARHRAADPVAAAADLQSRMIADMHRAHQRLSLLYRLSERLRATAKPAAVLDEGVDLILEALPTAARVLIMLRSGLTGTLKIVAGRNRTADDTAESDIRISRTLLEWVLTEKMALMTPDVSADSRLKDSESIRVGRFNAVICVPMMVSHKVVGLIYVDSEDLLNPLNQEDVAFTTAVGHELAMAIVNAQLQRSVIRSERMAAIGLTVSNLAHNIKNLAMMNQNALELMRIHLDRIQDDKIERCWQIIEKGFTRTNTLSMDMLEYAREERLAPVSTDINRLIRENADLLFNQHLAASGANLILAMDDCIPEWVIDPKQFQRALVNIVVNAVDAVAKNPDGKIRIATSLGKDGRFVVAITDNGCGIPADKRKRIFDLFFTTKGTSGSGLGLPMVNKFVTASGGRLTVASKPGAGTLFKMAFPPGR